MEVKWGAHELYKRRSPQQTPRRRPITQVGMDAPPKPAARSQDTNLKKTRDSLLTIPYPSNMDSHHQLEAAQTQPTGSKLVVTLPEDLLTTLWTSCAKKANVHYSAVFKVSIPGTKLSQLGPGKIFTLLSITFPWKLISYLRLHSAVQRAEYTRWLKTSWSASPSSSPSQAGNPTSTQTHISRTSPSGYILWTCARFYKMRPSSEPLVDT